MQPPIKRAPVKEIALHKPIAQPTQYLYPREPPRNEKFTDHDDQHRKGQQRQSYGPSPPQQQQQPAPIVLQHKMESHSRRSSVTSREEEEVRPILTKNRPNYNPQRFREIFRADEEPETPKQNRHYIEPSSPEQGDIRKRPPPVQRMPSRDYEHEETPINYEKHFARPIMMDRSVREDHHNPPESHSYIKSREMDKAKFTRAESQDRMLAAHKQSPPTRESKFKPDYYKDDMVKVAESDHGTTSSLEKFMMRQQQSGKASSSPVKAQYKEPVVHEKEVTYRPDNDEYYFERNPYREQESQPYRESMEKMLKSPVMRYNSFDEPPTYVEEEKRSGGSHRSRPSYEYQQSTQHRRYPGDAPAVRGGRNEEKMIGELSKLQVSPQDRFRDARDKFQKMEKVRGHVEPVHYAPPPAPPTHQVGVMPRRSQEGQAKPPPSSQGPQMKRDSNDRMIGNMNSLHRNRMSSNGHAPQQPPQMRSNGNGNRRLPEWSSEEDTDREREHAMMREMHQGPRNGKGGAAYRELGPGDRFPGLDRPDGGRLAPAKSLGNLVKGYRHSYAEPHNMMTRSGRVGLAAVNPY